jgi:hypothetical protein
MLNKTSQEHISLLKKKCHLDEQAMCVNCLDEEGSIVRYSQAWNSALQITNKTACFNTVLFLYVV